MVDFIREQTDFVLFFNGLSFIVLFVICFVLRKNRDTSLNKSLQESEERFHSLYARLEALVQAIPDIIFLRDMDGKYLMVNKALEEFSGIGPEGFIGKTNEELMPPDLAEMCRRSDEKALRSGEPIIAEERALRSDGELRYLDVIKSPVRDSEGNITGLIGVARDITERKQVEDLLEQAITRATEEKNKSEGYRVHLEELVRERTAKLIELNESLQLEITERKQTEKTLKESEGKFKHLSNEFHTLLDAIPDSLMLLSPEMKVLWANTGTAEAIGADVSELTGRYCHKLWHGRLDPCRNCPAMRCFETGQMEYFERATLNSRVWEVRAFPLKNDSGATINVIVLTTDITEKIALQQEAVRTGQLAALGELAAGVAHEINNPINGIINYAQILIDQAQKQGADNKIAGKIIKEGERIAKITGGLLSFARDSNEKKKPITLIRALSDSLSLVMAQLRKDGINVIVNVPQDMPEVLAHFGQLQQVFINIISNSRYALNTKHTSPHPDKTIEISGESIIVSGETYIKVTFHDRGTGIPAIMLNKIMNPFFSTKPAGEGTGLGLSISHGIIKDHNGRLAVESAENMYTKVIIELPAINYQQNYE